jgi:hypothetical protein
MNLVLDFGGVLRNAVYAAFRGIVARHECKIMVLPIADELDLMYREFRGTLDEALGLVADGRCGSVQVEGCGAVPILAGLYRPRFAEQPLADWSASAEGLGVNAEAAFEELQRMDGLAYIALSNEESPEFGAEHVTLETFPWADWRLVAGAVRAKGGEWIVRRRAA